MKAVIYFFAALFFLTPITKAQEFSPAVFLENHVAGLPHEITPFGVPASYDWEQRSTINPNNATLALQQGTNFWGNVFTGNSSVQPQNTRVEVRNCQYWTLNGAGIWKKVDGPLAPNGGSGYRADFVGGAPFDVSYANNTTSYKTQPGTTSHFWNGDLNAPINISDMKHVFVSCATRLVLENPSDTDDRAQASFAVNVGADWRLFDPPWGCPVTNGNTTCIGLGSGKFIKPTNNWRLAVFTTLPTAELNKTSNLSLSAFELPDGTFPDGGVNISITPRPTQPQACGRKSEGDANCDGIINLIDYEIWRQEFMTIITTSQANFNGSAGAPDLVDYEIWRRTFVGGAAQSS